MGKPRVPQITLSRELAEALIALDESYRGRSKEGWVEHVKKNGTRAAVAARNVMLAQGERILSYFGAPVSEESVDELAGVAGLAFWRILLEEFEPWHKWRAERLPGLVKGVLVYRIIDELRTESHDRFPRLIARAVDEAAEELRTEGVVRPTSRELARASAKRLKGKTMKGSRKLARKKNPTAYFNLLGVHSTQAMSVVASEGGNTDVEVEFDFPDRRGPKPDLQARAMEFFRLLFEVSNDPRFRLFLYHYLACDLDMKDAGSSALKLSHSRACQLFSSFKRSLFTRLDLTERRDQTALLEHIRKGAPPLWAWLSREEQQELMAEFGISRAV